VRIRTSDLHFIKCGPSRLNYLLRTFLEAFYIARSDLTKTCYLTSSYFLGAVKIDFPYNNVGNYCGNFNWESGVSCREVSKAQIIYYYLIISCNLQL
jgi:hypothetical protein